MSSDDSGIQSLVTSFNNQAWTYDIRLGNATRAVSEEIIDLAFPSLRRPDSAAKDDASFKLPERAKVLDVACGTGAFTLSLAMRCKASASPAVESIFATDIAPNMIELLSTTLKQHGLLDTASTPGINQPQSETKQEQPTHSSTLLPRVSAAVCDGQDHRHLFPAPGVFDLIVCNFGIFFYPEPVRGAAEMHRLLSDGRDGCGAAVVATCWEQMGNWPIFAEVQRRVAPRQAMQVVPTPAWCDGTLMERTLRDAGFAEVDMVRRRVVQWARGLPALCRGLAELLRGQCANVWTEEERDPQSLARVIGEVLREDRDKYLVELDEGGGEGAEDAKIGFELTAWIVTARKTAA